MKCPVCGLKELQMTTKDLPYTYKGETIVVRNVTGQYCSFCDEMVLEGEELKRFSDASMKLNKGFTSTVLEPHRVCKKQAQRIFPI